MTNTKMTSPSDWLSVETQLNWAKTVHGAHSHLETAGAQVTIPTNEAPYLGLSFASTLKYYPLHGLAAMQAIRAALQGCSRVEWCAGALRCSTAPGRRSILQRRLRHAAAGGAAEGAVEGVSMQDIERALGPVLTSATVSCHTYSSI